MEKYIAAVDLGTKKITVLAGKKTASGKIHVPAHHEAPSRGIVQGEVRNNVEVGNDLKKLVDELKQQTGIDIRDVYVGVSGEHIRCTKKTSETRRKDPTAEISEEEIQPLKRDMYTHASSDNRVLDVIPQIYHLDNGYSVTNPVGVCGHLLKAEFCVLTAAGFPVELVERSIQRAGLRLKGLFLSPLAAAEAVLSDDEKNMGVAVVDIGGGATSVAIYYDDIVRHVAVIPFGGNVITDDIKQGCAISTRYAEQLKVQYGSCYSDLIKENPTFKMPGVDGGEVSLRTLTKIIEARMDEIIEAVDYIIRQSGYADRLSAGIVLTGGGARLGGLTEFVRYKTGMKARKGAPLCLTSDSDADIQHGDYATVAGLLLKGAAEKEPEFAEPEIFDPVMVDATPPPAPAPKPPAGNNRKAGREKKKNILYTIPDMFAAAAKEYFTADNGT
jgi:cell division protein FtsA